MANPYQPPVIDPTTRTYTGAVCSKDPSHGGLRYRANGGCVRCIKLNAFDRRQDKRMFRQSPRQKAFKEYAHKTHLETGMRKLREAAVEFRAAKENANRGEWVKNVEAYGVPRKAIAGMRRWLESLERQERAAKTTPAAVEPAKEPAKSWMD